ncbi:MAG: divergent polysaccharide deacetylase family protein [Kordiimonadaceae bacterium]|nr:divergent polysaccharide deacetylase family protein [Kordiimonadaceae bacterium]
MLANVNALMIAWATSLILTVGGVLLLEATYSPAANHGDHAAAENADETAPDTDSHTAQPEAQSNDTHTPTADPITGRPAPGQPTDHKADTDPSGTSTVVAIEAPRIIPAIALPDLLEQSPQGALPKIAQDGRTAFTVYAAPTPKNIGKKPRIALMVTDLGMRSRITRRALAELPNDVSLAFSPYSPNLNGWGEQARRAGFEVFLTVPMEPVNYPQNDPGPLTLLTELSRRDNTNILRATMQKLTGYVGVVNHMGSRFTAASDSIKPVLEEIHKRGLMFVDSRTTPYSRAATMARAIGLPVAINNGYIDEDLAQGEIAAELTKLEQRARTQGAAMGLARPYPVTLNAIKVWAAALKDRDFVLVPATSIANLQAIPR